MKNKHNKNSNEIITINKELKSKIKIILKQISKALIKEKLKQIQPKNNNENNKFYANDLQYVNKNLILNELPLEQQISIFQDSIQSLNNKINKIEEFNKINVIKNNEKFIDVFQINNEIKIKKEKLYEIQKENLKLFNVYNMNKKNYENFEILNSKKNELNIFYNYLKLLKE